MKSTINLWNKIKMSGIATTEIWWISFNISIYCWKCRLTFTAILGQVTEHLSAPHPHTAVMGTFPGEDKVTGTPRCEGRSHSPCRHGITGQNRPGSGTLWHVYRVLLFYPTIFWFDYSIHVYATLTHWGRVTHICVGKLIIIGSDNGLSPGRRQAIIWTNAGIWSMGPLGTNFSEILIEIHIFSFKKIHLKMSSAKWRLFCLGLNELKQV